MNNATVGTPEPAIVENPDIEYTPDVSQQMSPIKDQDDIKTEHEKIVTQQQEHVTEQKLENRIDDIPIKDDYNIPPSPKGISIPFLVVGSIMGLVIILIVVKIFIF